MTKTFGEGVEKVLFVFDGTQAPDMNALTAQVGLAGRAADRARAAGRAAGLKSSALALGDLGLKSSIALSAAHPPPRPALLPSRSLRR